MKLKAIFAVTLFSLVINGSAWAKIWNCELNVTMDGDGEPCIVGTFDANWVAELKHSKGDATTQDYLDYYKSCNITNVIKEIGKDEDKCKVKGWNMILFKTNDVMAKDPKFKSPSGSNDKAVIAKELWKSKSGFNGGEITITDSATIKMGSSVLVAGYNVLVDNDDDDICIGDPNNDKPCTADSNSSEDVNLDGKPMDISGPDENCADYGECGDDFGAEPPGWNSDEPPPNFDDPPEDGSDYPTVAEDGSGYPMEGDDVKEALAEQEAEEAQADDDMDATSKEMDKEQEVEYKYNGPKKYSKGSTEFCPSGFYEAESTGDEGQHYIFCWDDWMDDIITDDMAFHYGWNLTSPANWNGGKNGGVTIFAGDRNKEHESSVAPFGSYSKITVNNNKSSDSAFTVNGTLVLRDLQIFVKKGRLATIKSGGRLFLENVVVICGEWKKACNSDSLIKNNGQLFINPNSRFYISENAISKLPEHFSYIDINSSLPIPPISFYSHEYTDYGADIQTNTSPNGVLNATVLPATNFPIKTDKEKIVKVNLGFEKYYTEVLKNMNLDKCLTVFSISMGYLISNGADDLLLSLSDKLSDPYSPYFDRLFICSDTAYKFERDCVDDGYIIEAGGKLSCQPHPGGGWEYDATNSSFICDEKGGAIKLSDGTCLKNGCPYGSVSNSGANACECPAGTEKFESEGSFVCIKTCSEKDQINWIKKDLLKDGSADGTNLKGKTLVYFGNLGGSSDGFKALSNKDRCDCVSPYTMLFNGTCVDVAKEETNCKATKGASAVYDAATGKCGCAEGYLDIGGKCEASIMGECNSKGSAWKYNNSTNKCECKLEEADPATCACPAGATAKPDINDGFKNKCMLIDGGGKSESDDEEESPEDICTGEGLELNDDTDKCVCQDGWYWIQKNNKGVIACSKNIEPTDPEPPTPSCNASAGEVVKGNSCVCDTVNDWFLSSASGKCQYFGGGNGGDSAPKDGCGLNIATGGGAAGTAQNFAMLLPYLLVLIGLRFGVAGLYTAPKTLN